MQLLVWITLIAIVVFLYRASRPLTFDDDPKQARGRYVIFNRMFGNVCFEGRTFRSPRAAQKLFERETKKNGLLFPEMMEIRQVV